MGIQEFVQKNMAKVYGAVAGIKSELDQLKGKVDMLGNQQSLYSEIFEIEGRPVYYELTGSVLFTTADQGNRGPGIAMQVSQDGPFIQTHYPLVLWRPTLPANANNLGLWRPVSSFPLDTQAAIAAVPIDLNADIISISYEIEDGGSQRMLQSAAIPPLISTPNDLKPLPVWTLFTPNATVTFHPTYRSIRFNDVTVPPTEGALEVVLPGFRIVNM